MQLTKHANGLLSIYFTAGYPTLDSTVEIAKTLEESGVDFLEIGFPYSDPVADGPTIQHASEEEIAAIIGQSKAKYIKKQL